MTKSVEAHLDEVSYVEDLNYVPSQFAIDFINFVKIVNSDSPEENKTPVMHYRIIDTFQGENQNVINMCARGTAKTTILEHLILYLAVYGEIPNYGKIQYCLFIGDNEKNGIAKMKLRLENRWSNSAFLQTYLPESGKKITENRWAFTNIDGTKFVCTGHGAQQGFRGTVELGTRPQLGLMDDLIKDAAATSPAMIEAIENTIKLAMRNALHPTLRKVVWCGTPFNAGDPFYKAAESGAWKVNVFPICKEFPCEEEDFQGAWSDRFSYDMLKKEYDFNMLSGSISAFNQELMLRIMSKEDRLIRDSEILWYSRDNLLENKDRFNFYITTDFATSEKSTADFRVISVWAYNNAGHWFWVDGICNKDSIHKFWEDLFRLNQLYNPQQVALEVSGQQQGLVKWVESEMMKRNNWMNLASENNSGSAGIRPKGNKFQRFYDFAPRFAQHTVHFPTELKEGDVMSEFMTELTLVSQTSFRSKHDDCLDTISMLASLTPWKPTEEGRISPKGVFSEWEEETHDSHISSYIV